MTKAEMQWHATTYRDLNVKARSAEHGGLYQNAVRLSVEAWQHMDGMLRFEKASGGRENDFATIGRVLTYAPLLLDPASLNSLESFLSETRRIQKNTDHDLAANLNVARVMLWKNHLLWSAIEEKGELDHGDVASLEISNHPEATTVLSAWEKMGLIIHCDGRYLQCTQLGAIVPAKCPSCGKIERAPKAMLLDRISCPVCKSNVMFVFVRSSFN